MPSPPIQVFLTTIASQPALRQRQEYILRILQAKRIPYKSYDLASDEEAKRLWRRKAPVDKQQLPGILVGGKCPGSFTDFEEAVEFDELAIFLRLNDPYDPAVEEDRPILEEKPIGVPGAQSPSQMAKLHHKASWNSPGTSSPSPLAGQRAPSGTHLSSGGPADPEMQKVVAQRNDEEFDVGEELVGFGLQGVKVTEDDLLQLVADLGLEGDDAGDLVKGLSSSGAKESKVEKQLEPKVEKREPKIERKEESRVQKKEEPRVEEMEPKVEKEEPKVEEKAESKVEEKGDKQQVDKQMEKDPEKAVGKEVEEVAKNDTGTEIREEDVAKPEEGTPQEVEKTGDAKAAPTETEKKGEGAEAPKELSQIGEQKIPEVPSITFEQVMLEIDQETPTLPEPKENKKAIPEPIEGQVTVKEVPKKSEAKEASKEVPGEQAAKEIAQEVPGKNEVREPPKEAQTKDVAEEATKATPRKSEAKETTKVTVVSRKSEAKEVTREAPRQSVAREVTKEPRRPNVTKELPKELPAQSAAKESVPELPTKSVAKEIPRETPKKSEAKETTRETPRKSMIPRKVSTPKLEVPRKSESKEVPKATSTVKPLKFRKSEAGKRATNIPPTPERRPRAALEMERPDLNL